MALNFNTSPYFDDFDATKKFARILFKPGVAVQARELTQLQTILSENAQLFADHFLTDGTPVAGGKGLVKKRDYIKINDLDASSATVNNDDLANYIGDTVTGGTSGIVATINKVETGLDTDAVDKKTLYISYTQGDDTGTYLHFESGETLTVTSDDSGRNGDTFVVDNGTDANDVTRNYFGNGLFFTIEEGIIYIGGEFVRHDTQEITLEKYKNAANTYVGVKKTQSLVTSDDDSSLQDPATGTFNFNAPGADRYKVTTTIAKLGLTATNDADFVSMYKVEDGVLTTSVQDDLDQYRILGDKLAERTFDESGNYVIKQFNVGVREHLKTTSPDNNGYLTLADGGDADKIAVTVSDGIGIVKGRKRSFLGKSHLPIDKGTRKVIEEGFTTSTAYGNYVLVEEVCGNWDLADGDLVELYDTAANAVTDTTYSGHGTVGTKIGQARIRQIRWESGTPGAAAAQYRLYLYDIRMYGGAFADVRMIYYEDSTADGFADTVLESSVAVLKETSFNQMVFRSPTVATSRLNVDTGNTYDLNYTYQKAFDVTVATDGTATITVTGNETFPYSSTPTQTIIDQEIVAIVQSAVTVTGGSGAGSYTAGQHWDVQTSDITSVSSTAINFDFGTSWSTATDMRLYIKIKVTDEAPVSFNNLESRYVTIDTSTHPAGADGPWNLGVPNIYKIENVYIGASSGSYLTSGTDFKDQFILDSGQRDNMYAHSKLIRKGTAVSSTTSKKITIKYSALSPNYGSANSTYFAVDSYPVDDTGASGIFTYEIPVYYSENLGSRFDLRDCIDFRPFVKKTAADTTSIGSATENPNESFELDDTADYEFPIPTESFTTDAEYYLGRIDRVVLTEKGVLEAVEGDYSKTPTPPVAPSDTMTLATVAIPPYPSISPFVGKANRRRDLQCQVRLRQNRRFTMQDIGAIESRINRLEYYSALNFLERDTKDKLILDASGNDRFKNGFFVDNFVDYNLANRANTDLKYALNPHGKFGTCTFREENVDVVFDSTNSTNVTRTGNLVHLDISSHKAYIENEFASKFRNCVGDLLFNWRGDMELYPPSDNYTHIESGGERNIDITTIGDAIEGFATDLGEIGLEGGTQLTMGNVRDGDTFGGSDTSPILDTASDRAEGVRARASISGSVDASFSGTTQIRDLTLSNKELSISATSGETIKDSFGDVITDISLSKFMRPITVTVVATRLKPTTRFYPFFDGDDVASNCKPIPYSSFSALSDIDDFWSILNDATNDYGDNLVSDSQGRLVIQFRIPEGKFRIGSRVFRLADDSQNRDSFVTSSADATFDSFGMTAVSNELSLSTQIPNIQVSMNTSDPQPVGSVVSGVRIDDFTVNSNVDLNLDLVSDDPIAQTFSVRDDTGVFITKADLYFRSKSTTNGVTIQIRETVNGFPGKKIIPYGSKYLQASEVNTSTTAEDGTVTFNATTVTFDSPVYLKPGAEYCLVIMPAGNDPNYEVWVSQLGENKVGTTERILAPDTSSGVLFSSSNNKTWTPYQDEDLKYTIYRAKFDTADTGTVKMTNSDIDYLKLTDFTDGYPAAGDNVHAFSATIDTAGSGYAVNDVITLNTFGNGTGAKIKVLTVSSGAISTFEFSDLGTGYTADGANIGQASTTGSGTGAIFDITTKTGIIEYMSEFFNVARVRETKENFATSDVITNGSTDATIDTIEDKKFNKITHNIGELIFAKTGLSYEYAPTVPTGVSTKGTTDFNLKQGVMTSTNKEYAVYSKANEVANLSSNKSFNITGSMTTTDDRLSPVIDLARSSFIIQQNLINNTDTNENKIKNGSANAKYISKTVTLDDGQEAEDVQVFVDAQIPQDASIGVYIKAISEEDDGDFDNDLYWTEMELVETPKDNGLAQSKFVEYNYKIPDKGSAPSTGLNSGVFEYDIYRVKTGTVTTAGSGYTSAPTLTWSGGTADTQAAGFATISAGAISSVVITNPGRYQATTVPTVTVTGGGGSSGAITSGTPTLTTFKNIKKFAIKIVFLAGNTSKTPKVRNLRAIALQA